MGDTEHARHEAEDCGRLVSITRQELGWTRARLAAAADMTETAVAHFEDGRTFPVQPAMEDLLRAMGRVD